MLTDDQRAVLAAFADRVVPPDDAPGGSAVGAVAFVEDLLGDALAPQARAYQEFLDQLAADGFTGATPAEQDALLTARESSAIFRLAVETIHEAYWTSSVGRALVGFTERG